MLLVMVPAMMSCAGALCWAYRHQIQLWGSCVLQPIDCSSGNSRRRVSAWGWGCPQGGDQQKPELSLSICFCLTLTRSLPMALGSEAGFKLVSKHLLFKRLVQVPALLLFWCLCCIKPPCFCIYLFPSNYWGHAVLT